MEALNAAKAVNPHLRKLDVVPNNMSYSYKLPPFGRMAVLPSSVAGALSVLRDLQWPAGVDRRVLVISTGGWYNLDRFCDAFATAPICHLRAPRPNHDRPLATSPAPLGGGASSWGNYAFARRAFGTLRPPDLASDIRKMTTAIAEWRQTELGRNISVLWTESPTSHFPPTPRACEEVSDDVSDWRASPGAMGGHRRAGSVHLRGQWPGVSLGWPACVIQSPPRPCALRKVPRASMVCNGYIPWVCVGSCRVMRVPLSLSVTSCVASHHLLTTCPSRLVPLLCVHAHRERRCAEQTGARRRPYRSSRRRPTRTLTARHALLQTRSRWPTPQTPRGRISCALRAVGPSGVMSRLCVRWSRSIDLWVSARG